MRKVIVGLSVLVLALTGSAVVAGGLEKGDNEFSGTFIFSNTSVDGGGDINDGAVAVGWGYMLTDAHEVGTALAYLWANADGFASESGGSISGFYHYNFSTGENMNPYIGVQATTFFGDLGDVFDDAYGVQGGIKLWPWEHGGFNFAINYQKVNGAGGGELDILSTGIGVELKF